MGIARCAPAKSVAVIGGDGEDNDARAALLLRGDHVVNEIKLAEAATAWRRLPPASEAEIADHLGSEPGFLGPVAPKKRIRVIADRSVAAMHDFVIGANEPGFHLAGVNWGRDLPEPELIADIRNVVAGDPSPDGRGTLQHRPRHRGRHVFRSAQVFRAMDCTVLDASGRERSMAMGCYGIGVSRIVGAAIEQNHDARGILWPEPMAPWRVAVCLINYRNDPAVNAAAEALYARLNAAGIETALDDRGLRPARCSPTSRLIGIPHRVVVSARAGPWAC